MAEIVDPFKIGESLGNQNKVVTERYQQADTLLGDFMQENDQIQAKREANLAGAVDAKKAVADQALQQTQQFANAVQPILQRRVAIADREAEIAGMNPFKRAIMGLVSREYNKDALSGADQAAQGQLQAHGQQFQQNMQLNDTILKTVVSQYEDEDSKIQLHQSNLDQDVRLQAQYAGSAAQVFGAQIQGLQAQTELVRAQAQARQDLLSGMTLDDANKALTMAKQNGGKAVVNGVELRQGELQEVQMNWQEKNLALQSRRLAIQSQQMGLAAQYEEKIIRHMTGPELDSAIKNGGVFNGQKLDQTQLTQAYLAQQQRNTAVANQAVSQSAIGIAQAQVKSLNQTYTQLHQRSVQLFGQVPRELNQQGIAIGAQLNAYQQGYEKANAVGAGAEYVRQNLPTIQNMMEAQGKMADSLVKRWAGGNAQLEVVGKAWLTGTPLSSDASLQGLVQLARTGLPPGTKLSGAAAQQFEIAKRIIAEHDGGAKGAAGPGATMESLWAKATGKATQKADPTLLTDLSRALTNNFNATSLDRVIEAAPQVAQHIKGADGKPIPFSRVKPEDFYMAVQQGDNEGYRILGQKLGLKPEDAKLMFAQGPAGQIAQTVKGKKIDGKEVDFATLSRQLQSIQTQSTMQALDNSSSATSTFKPSLAFAQAMKHPEFQAAMINGVAGSAQSNVPEFLMHNIAPNGFDSTLYNYGNTVASAYNVLAEQRRREQIRSAPDTLQSPERMTQAVIGSMGNINGAERQALLAEIKKQLGLEMVARRGMNVALGLDKHTGLSAMGMSATDMGLAIKSAKFNDPALEDVRKRAASQWDTSYQATSNLLRSLMDD